MEERNIALIGFRATGKSTVGKVLAAMLGRVFIDMDTHLTASRGREISCWVRLEGWDSFRKAESELLEVLGSRDGLVVATGGGVVLSPPNRLVLERRFYTVWLRASAQTIQERITADPSSLTNRPPLSELPMEREIRDLLTQREPLYAASADLAIDTEGKSPEQIAGIIRDNLP